jgi:iron complex transport system ATP-binding protein
MMSLLITENLTVGIGKRILIESLSWRVQQGEFWCILGRNGSGKSSLLYTLSGLLPPCDGQIFLGHKELRQMGANELARYRGLVQQVQTDAFAHSVLDAVTAGRTPYHGGHGWYSDDDIKVADAALASFGLLSLRHADVTKLSGGERQRVALAALVAQDPRLMLMDEPISHQDVGKQVAVMRIARGMADQRAVIASCHDINLAMRFATHLLILGENQHWLGSVAELVNIDVLEAAFGCQFTLRDGTYFVL